MVRASARALSGASSRWVALDALRGAAMVWMAVFHFCFDLQNFNLLSPPQNFYADPFWTWQRTAIVSVFLFCAGFGQAAAVAAGQTPQRFWRRWAQVASCALLVSAGSALMFPRSWISFGVLHGIALMLIVCRFAAPATRWLLLAAALALVLPMWVSHPVFDSRMTNWVGLITHKPITEDFVPLLPWLGVMLLGLAAGREYLIRPVSAAVIAPPPQPSPPLLVALAALGRWPLSFYMLHQPLLIGGLLAWQALTT
jgi:uncharacterized membrane protein